MAYSESLAGRLRDVLARKRGVVEQKFQEVADVVLGLIGEALKPTRGHGWALWGHALRVGR